MTDTLLLIEDDLPFCQLAELVLTKKGFQVEVAHNVIAGLQKAYTLHPDAVILDIMLPDLDGWQACARLREISDVPIIMLTALGSAEDVIKGLNLGADAYIIKPVTVEELSARIRAVLQRVARTRISPSVDQNTVFTYHNLVVDFNRHEVTLEGQGVIDLSPTEFQLLAVLIQHQGRLLPYEFLLKEVWGSEYLGEVDYLRLYISYLRRKIEKDPIKPGLIHTEWGVGYRFGEMLPHLDLPGA